jgi:hypothetical protein
VPHWQSYGCPQQTPGKKYASLGMPLVRGGNQMSRLALTVVLVSMVILAQASLAQLSKRLQWYSTKILAHQSFDTVGYGNVSFVGVTYPQEPDGRSEYSKAGFAALNRTDSETIPILMNGFDNAPANYCNISWKDSTVISNDCDFDISIRLFYRK